MTTRMPFGKWRGTLLTDIDGEYLDWLLTIGLRPRLREAVADEVQRRKDERENERRWRNWQQHQAWEEQQRRAAAALPKARGIDGAVAQEIITKGYRLLSLQAHPDRGGTTQQMQAVNLAADWLRETVRRALPETSKP